MKRIGCCLVACSCLVASFAWQPAMAVDVYVANEDGTVSIVDTVTNEALITIPLITPGGVQPGRGVALSSRPGEIPRHAFVTGGSWVFVIDERSRQVLQQYDLSADLGFDVELRACASALPTEFDVPDPTGGPATTEIRSLLHVAATRVLGPDELDSHFVVLDQECLIAAGCRVLVDAGRLAGRGSRAVGVTVLDSPAGLDAQRAWYTVRDPSTHSVRTFRVVTPRQVDFHAFDSRDVQLPSAMPLPERLQVAAAEGRESSILTLGELGLINLRTGATCQTGGDLAAATLTGPAPNSYALFVATRDDRQLRVLDPTDCTGSSYRIGDEPTDIAVLEDVTWASAFVANRGSNTVTRLDNDGTLTTIALCSVPGCDRRPNALAVFDGNAECRIENFTLADLGDGDSVLADWDTLGCPVGNDYSLWCKCMEFDPACPCFCPCGEDTIVECGDQPGPGCCACPTGSLVMNGGGVIDAYEWDELYDVATATGWKKLGTEPPFAFASGGYPVTLVVTQGPPPAQGPPPEK